MHFAPIPMTPHKRKAQFTSSLPDKRTIRNDKLTAQHPSSPLLDQLASDVINMSKAGRHDEAILLTTHATIKMIEIQAGIWERKANITRELQDALMIMQLDPQNINAYLRAGNLYSIQGKQKAAVTAFEQGRDVACNEETRAMFQERIDTAKARLDRRVDFIAQSPLEIVSNIAGYLDMYAVIDTCMNVSRTWHTIFLNCPRAWESMHMLDDFHTTKVPGDLLATVSRHVKNLEIAFSTNEGWDNMLLITACTFSNLRSLSIAGHRYHQRPFANLDILYQLLQNISPSLNELEIVHWSPRVSVGWILSTCRNLTTIKFSLGSISEYVAGMSPLPHTTQLTRIDIDLKRMTVSPEIFTTLEPLFQQSPNLRYFHMDPMTNPQGGLSIVAQHCPNLEVISTSDISLFLLQEDMAASSTAFDKCHVAGLRVLVLDNINSMQTLYPHLGKSCRTLEALHITTNYDHGTLEDWKPLSSFVMHKLTYLSIDHKVSQDVFCNHLGHIVRCLPVLEIFKLSSDCGMLPKEAAENLFDALAELRSLSTLQLTRIGIHDQPLMRLLQHHSAKQSSALQTLEFNNCPGMTGPVTQEAARIRSLLDLTVYYPNERLDTADFAKFAKSIGELPKLHKLRLSHMTMTDDSASDIAACTSLQFLSLTAMKGLTVEGRMLLVKNIKQVVARK